MLELNQIVLQELSSNLNFKSISNLQNFSEKLLLSLSPNFSHFMYLFSLRFLPGRKLWCIPLGRNGIYTKIILIDQLDGDSIF